MKHSAKEADASVRDERPNAVVMERSGTEEGDIQLRREVSLRALVTKLDEDAASGEAARAAEQGTDVAGLMYRLAAQSILELSAGFMDARSLRVCLCTSTSAGHWCMTGGESTADAESARQRLRNLQVASDAHMHRFIVASGSRMEKQFVPWYFGVAFAFLFKFCTGMPDMPEWSSVPRHRRGDDAPAVPLPLWVKSSLGAPSNT